MSYLLTEYEHKMLREKSQLGDAFRAGARCEAMTREAATVVHRELLDYARALAEHHPDWSSSRIADSIARVFAAEASSKPEARCSTCGGPQRECSHILAAAVPTEPTGGQE